MKVFPYSSNFETKQHICKGLLTQFQILKPKEGK